jgi:diguanylate cyclase (GGDEF)-like protein
MAARQRAGDNQTTRVVVPPGHGDRRDPACVVVVAGAQLGHEAAIGELPLLIGRADDCGLVLADSSVSRRHCAVSRFASGYVVEDLGSTNGCFVNGEPVTRAALRDGDRLRIGHYELKFFGEGSAEAKYHRELLNQAVFDALTGFYNRRQSREMLEHAFDRGRRESSARVHLMILDLDHFKPINDHHGHLAGDRVLAGFAELVRTHLPPDCVVGRLGGEEFVVFSAQASENEFRALAEAIRLALEAATLSIDQGEVRLTVSIGIAIQEPTMRLAADLLRTADRALYEAKQGGRNRVVVA